ncbi:NADPH:quinone reductase [Nocardia bhagyanarayanae]|uniref:NADPH:quinone reductase-like Zn-dependent oxidoreductase n=1 Tax=Nocardia bhagyanarayanae TaxID=1215925 RepID=A0A543EV71_9NOCA|nr:NADPH:quinone reductase [Nocardia bhagyanarayanae]TQM25459.1 NADPH:quinone reductase-like Zn-dependent oxidoreductase [Nocardia bhagyanarayanae]
MRAAYIERLGPSESIVYGELPPPVRGPGDVLVGVMATAVNPVDTFVRSGRYPTAMEFPFVIGRDLVGNVVESPSPEFAPGDQVWCNSLGHEGRQGAAAELAVVPVDRLYHLPDGASPTETVAIVHPAAAAYLAAFTHGHLRPGDTALIAGAAGNVGSALVALISRAGGTVIATADPDDHDYCRRVGAAHTIDYRERNIVDEVRGIVGSGVDLYIDTSGRNDMVDAVAMLAVGGRVVVMAGTGSRSELPTGTLYLKDGSIRGFVISRATVTQLREAATVINRHLLDGALRPRAIDLLPLSAAAEAHRRIETERLRGTRLVLEI